MGILHVVDRVLIALSPGQIEVKIQVRVVPALQEEEPHRVHGRLVEQLLERHEVRAPLSHAHRLTVAQERHELVDQHPDPRHIVPEGPERRHDVAVGRLVVGAEDVDDPIETSSELVHVVGDVGQPVGGFTRRLDQNPVLVEAEIGAAEPDRALLLVGEPLLAKGREHRVHGAVLVEARLVEVDVEVDAHPPERAADLGEERLLGELLEAIDRRLRPSVPLQIDDPLGNLSDVLAVVPVLGERHRAPEKLEVARAGRLGQELHLPACVIEVVLACDLVAGALEQPRDRVAQHRLPPVPDREGAGRVRAHELHLHATTLPRLRVAVRVSPREDLSQRLPPQRVGHEDVDEPRPGDLDPLDRIRTRGKVPDQQLRDLPGALARRRGQEEREVRGVIAMLTRLGGIEVPVREIRPGEEPGAHARTHAVRENLLYFRLQTPSSDRALFYGGDPRASIDAPPPEATPRGLSQVGRQGRG